MVDSSTAYEEHANQFLMQRDQSRIGSKIVEQWCKTLSPNASGIELGCGGGYPITQTLDKHDVNLWAVDGSPTLVSTFKTRFPQIPVQCARVQDCDFFNRQFDFAIAIGFLFLLNESDQEKLIKDVSQILVLKGQFLLTAPVETGTWNDTNTGTQSLSLGESRYRQLFEGAGFHVESQYVDQGRNNYYDLKRVR